MDVIERRIKRVVSSRVESFVLRTLGADEQSRLEEAQKREQEARIEALVRAASRDVKSDTDTSSDSGTQPDAIREMMDEEDCPICTRILSQLAEMEEPRRTKGVAEYGEFRSAIDQSEEAAVEALENADVLPDALSNLREVTL